MATQQETRNNFNKALDVRNFSLFYSIPSSIPFDSINEFKSEKIFSVNDFFLCNNEYFMNCHF